MPVWPFLVLGLAVGIHAAWVLTPALVPDARPRGVALARHGGVIAMVVLFRTPIWAVTTPGGYFWPIWTFTALASAFAIHAGIQASVGRRREAEATERIEVLQETRAGAVDAQAAELRRIERDLHDGAQARLVALADGPRPGEGPGRGRRGAEAAHDARRSARSSSCATWPAASTRWS